MRVGIDLDGVCYDFAASVRQYLTQSSTAPHKYYPDPDCWEFYEGWGITLEQFIEVCNAGVDNGVIFTHGDPHAGTKAALDQIKAGGHTIHVITDRHFGTPGASAAATFRWLARHKLPYDTVTFTADKTIVNVDMMVDDKPSNVAALVNAGTRTWMMDQPWNTDAVGAARVGSLLEYAALVDLFAPKPTG